MSSSLILAAASSIVIAYYVLKVSSPWLIFPIYLAVFLAWSGYRILIYQRYLNPLSRLPGPKGHWLWGEFPTVQHEEPGQAHLRWLRQYRNPTGFLTFPGLFYTRQVIPTSSATVQHVTSNLTIYARPMFARKAIERVLGKGVLTAEGERHKRQRKILNPAFSTDYIRKIVPIFSAKASELVTVLLDYVKSQLAQEIDVFPLLTRVTLDIISSSGFGYDFNTLHNPGDPFAIAYAKISRMTPGIRAFDIAAAYIPFLRNLPFPRVMEIAEARKSISIRASKLVQEKQRQTIAGKDILSVMIDENRKSQGGLSETEIVDQIMTFLFAGHETTSTALAWGLHLLAQHLEIQDRLRAEVEHLDVSSFEQIESCRYLHNVCREILRYIPPVSAVRREASVTDYVNGVIIPKGTIVVIPILATNFDETIWGPDVDVFNPDRWMENTSKFSYLTFLQGPRSCIGRSFAETEMKVLLVALIQRLRFEEVVKGKHIERHTVITTRPKHGMVLKISAI